MLSSFITEGGIMTIGTSGEDEPSGGGYVMKLVRSAKRMCLALNQLIKLRLI